MTNENAQTVIELTDEEKQKTVELQRELMNSKVAVADADSRLVAAENARAEARARLSKATQSYFAELKSFAEAHQINLNDDTARWVFDLSKMTFTKQ